MNTRLLLSTGFLFLFFFLSAQPQKVLFIGNSYTYANNLPLMLSKLASSVGDSVNYASSTAGGQTLQGHSGSATTISMIQQGSWDYVVLQEQSQLPSFPMSQVSTEVFPFAKILCDTIRHFNNCTQPLFFMTWGRQNGDQGNCANWPPVCSYEGMDSLLSLRYRMMADMNQALVSPAGAVWHYIRDNYPSMNLYSSDGSHPSLLGSYAAACAFYTMVFQKSPALIMDDYGILHSEAVIIRTAAEIVVYDSLSKWNIGKYIPESDFIVAAIGDSISTTNNSKFADTYLWDFGDGNISSLFEPTHKYASVGSYSVSLQASKCDSKDVADTTFTIFVSSVEERENVDFKILPNPIEEYFTIKSDKSIGATNVCLYNMAGKKIRSFSNFLATEKRFNVADLPKGVYFLTFVANSELIRIKIVK